MRRWIVCIAKVVDLSDTEVFLVNETWVVLPSVEYTWSFIAVFTAPQVTQHSQVNLIDNHLPETLNQHGNSIKQGWKVNRGQTCQIHNLSFTIITFYPQHTSKWGSKFVRKGIKFEWNGDLVGTFHHGIKKASQKTVQLSSVFEQDLLKLFFSR